MKIAFTDSFRKDYRRLPQPVQRQLDKQLALLLETFHHPSLRAKKMKGHPSVWEGRISRVHRFTFQTEGEHLHSSQNRLPRHLKKTAASFLSVH